MVAFFSLGCKRPAPFHAPTREAGKQARQAPSPLGYSSLPLPSITWVPSGVPLLLQARSVHPPPLTSPDNIVALSSVCVRVCWMWVSSLPALDLPPLTVAVLLPQLSSGGPRAHTKHAFFFASLMRTRRKRGGKNAWQKKKGGGIFQNSHRGFIWQRQKGERGRVKRHSGWGRQICAHGTTLHPCYLSLLPDKQQYTTAGCCLSVMTTIVQISGCGQAQSLWLLDLDSASSGSVFHNSRETSSSHYVPFEAASHSGHKVPLYSLFSESWSNWITVILLQSIISAIH